MYGYAPHHPPRRQKHGSLIIPTSVANIRENGARPVVVECSAYRHAATMNVDHLDGAIPVPDLPLVLRLTCSKCGATGERIMARPFWAEQPASVGGTKPWPGAVAT